MHRFRGVFIPAKIWNNDSIDIISRCILAEIDANDPGDGWELDTKKLGNYFGVNEKMLLKRLTILEALGLVSVTDQKYSSLAHEQATIIIKSREEAKVEAVNARKIEDLEKYVKDNIGAYRGTKTKNQFVSLRALFLARYAQKSNELTGQPIAAEFGGKEGSLLKKDLERLGYQLLERCIELFFSDQEPEVANFTRFEKKAGYSFSILHAMIEKLMISKADPKVPCRYCGERGKHAYECPIEVKKRKDAQREREEYEKEREKMGDVSLTDMFRNRR